MPQVETLKCIQCGGEMKKKRESASSLSALILILVGFGLLFVFPVGTLFGIILLIAGLAKGSQMRFFWVCQNCGYKFERQPTWRDYIK